MRHPRLTTTAVLLGAALALGLASTPGAAASGPDPGDTAAAKRDKAETDSNGSTQAAQDYAFAEKAALVRKMKKELAKMRRELDRLNVKVDHSSGAARADAKAKLRVVRAKWVQAKKQLDRVASATESTWDEMKERLSNSYDELKDSLEKARQWLSDKLAPS
ncbi:MAG TPA: hypothetical protein VMU15_04375 [Anaeromyxobacter sp.]|nr:hypothetical protein [Anaeromyxobacter sp.]